MDKSLCDLPREVIKVLLSYLDYKTICRVSQVCKQLQICAYEDGPWKSFCAKYWLDEDKRHPEKSWRENFIIQYEDLGRYIDMYADVKRLWNRIFAVLEQKLPRVLETLLGPTTEENLNNLERLLGKPLPEEMRCSYRICNGQVVASRLLADTRFGLFGTFSVYNYNLSEVLLPVERIIENLQRGKVNKNYVEVTDRFLHAAGPEHPGQHGFSKRVCLNESGSVKVGNVFIQVDDSEKPGASFLFGENFIHWIHRLAIQLESPRLIIDNGAMLQFEQDPDCVQETYAVKVSVATVFVPEFSSLGPTSPRLMFAYRVTMAMDKNKHPRHGCTLERRHWEIVEYVSEANQRTQTVDGEAVVGYYPDIRPGGTFSYASWTPLTTRDGYMYGHFLFKNNSSGKIYDVVCPRFTFKCPEVKNFTFE